MRNVQGRLAALERRDGVQDVLARQVIARLAAGTTMHDLTNEELYAVRDYRGPGAVHAETTPEQQEALRARVVAVWDVTGEDIVPAIERYHGAPTGRAAAEVLTTWTDRELALYTLVMGDRRTDDHIFARAFTDEERARLAVTSAGWGDIWAS